MDNHSSTQPVATVVCGDVEFQKTLTDKEKAYIHEGSNFLSKFSRECSLKNLHLTGHTLDSVEALPHTEQKRIWAEARRLASLPSVPKPVMEIRIPADTPLS